MHSKSEFVRRTGIALAVIGVAIVAFIGVMIWAAYNLNQANQWVLHTHQVIETSQKAQAHVGDMEMRLRSYAITGDQTHAAAYVEDREQAGRALAEVKQLTSDNPEQQTLLVTLGQAFLSLQSGSRLVFDRDHAMSLEQATLLFHYQHAGMDRFRSVMHELIEDEQKLLETRSERLRSAQMTISAGIGASAITAIAVLGYVFNTVQQHVLWEKEARQALQDANSQLGNAQDSLRSALAHASVREHESQVANMRLTAVLSCMGEGLCQVDDKGLLTYMNPAGEAILGYKLEEVQGKCMHDIVHYLDAEGQVVPASECQLLQVIQKAVPYESHDDILITRDGTKLSVELYSGPLMVDGRVVGAVVSFQDITARKLADKRLREFYSTLSHELRTPLASIRATLAMMDDGMVGELSEGAAKLASVSRKECDRVVRLINDILDLSKIEAGTLDLSPVLQSPAELIERAVGSQSVSAQQKEITLTVDVAANAQQVWCDPDRTVQVVLNLLGNAVKFTPQGGKVCVRAEQKNAEVVISVKDSGPGIAPADLYKLFRRFGQLDVPTVARTAGTGLGLAICKAIVEQQGGKIGVDSAPGEGSTFWFTLPCTPKEADNGQDITG